MKDSDIGRDSERSVPIVSVIIPTHNRAEMLGRYGFFRRDLISGADYKFGRRLTGAGEKMIHIQDVVVKHPSRATLRVILKKR